VRRSRRRFWTSEGNIDSLSAFLTLYEVLVGTAKLTAPFTPFIAEDIYRNLVCRIDNKAFESVHLCDYPVSDERLIDVDLEDRMEFISRVVTLGRAARNEANLKVRQPLSEMKVVVSDSFGRNALKDMEHLLQEELNIKSVTAVEDSSSLMRYVAKPNFRNIGKGPYKAMMPQIKAHLENVNGNEVKKHLESGEYVFEIDGKPVTLKSEEVELQALASDEYSVQSDGKLSVALVKTLSRGLLLEGFARELVNKIQFMRKEQGFDIVDRIRVAYAVCNADEQKDIDEALESFGESIKADTLALKIERIDSDAVESSEWNINGINVKLAITKETK
jgi:isoleucyl-tRNA synthetase